jgi:hypothetical protein
VAVETQKRASKMNEIDPGQLKAILVRIIQITNADRIEINPLDDDLVHTKFVKGVYKNHLHGLLFKLGQLSFKKDTITVTRKFEALPHLVSSVPDSPITIDVDSVQDSNGCRRYYINLTSRNSPTRKKYLTKECKRILNTLSSEFIAKVQEIQPVLKRKDLRIQSLLEEMVGIRNESQEKDKRIYNLDNDFTEFKEQNQVKINIGEKLLKLSKTKKWKGM